ncbi:SGNH/GDSL hydrolase family protein [Capsulimonas corticalis]|uniref:SGNH/GDSL hydrolase family protein n=1 Tax=Capsulimonas corticalis TaxID=2219043 RepID=UPI00261E7259|nr:SGNH/GDSL hydrolase family protein [Capsulimonas corticalis]
MTPLLVLGGEAWMATLGPRLHYIDPVYAPMHFGASGPPLTYLVLGDSTAAGQGGDYRIGIAQSTARHLAETYRVTLINQAVSGATAADVVRDQLPRIRALKPDLVLISLGANDVTHFTTAESLRASLETIVTQILADRPGARIVLTASPQMGSVPRFAQPLRWFAGTQTTRINSVFVAVIRERRLTLAPLAAKTGPIFARDPSLFAADQFHPNDRGYAVWILVLNEALDRAMGNPYSRNSL